MLLVVLAAAVLLAGCLGEGDDASWTLLDGSAPGEAVDLEGVDGDVVVTSHVVLATASLTSESKAGSCLEERFAELEAGEEVVVRTGVATESVTALERGGHAVLGCSNSPGLREEGRWCGSSYGQFRSGSLTDPRLDIVCRARDGASIGFVWVEPGRGTRYVAVEQPGYTEVYEVAAGLPVRIATVSGVDVETSSATFEISEHDADGRLLREQTLEALVGG